MRTMLRSRVEAKNSGRSWRHVTDQIGMFCYSGLDLKQVGYFI
jgi:aspartate aminotransferase